MLYKKAADVGIFGDGFDAQYGGHDQRDAILRMVILQEISAAGSGGVVASLLSNYIGLPPIQRAEVSAMLAERSGVARSCSCRTWVKAPKGCRRVARRRSGVSRNTRDFAWVLMRQSSSGCGILWLS